MQKKKSKEENRKFYEITDNYGVRIGDGHFQEFTGKLIVFKNIKGLR